MHRSPSSRPASPGPPPRRPDPLLLDEDEHLFDVARCWDARWSRGGGDALPSPTGRLWVGSRSLYFEPAPALGGSAGLSSASPSSKSGAAWPPGTLVRLPLPAVTALRFGEDSDDDDDGGEGEEGEDGGGRHHHAGRHSTPPRPPPPPTTSRCRVWVDETVTVSPGAPARRAKGARLLECTVSARGAAKLGPRLARLRTLATDARLGGAGAAAAARAAIAALVADQQDAGAAKAAGAVFDAPAFRLVPGALVAGRVAVLPPPPAAPAGGAGALGSGRRRPRLPGLVRFLPVGPGLGGGAAVAAGDVALAIPRPHGLEPTGLDLVLAPDALLGDGESPGALSGGGGRPWSPGGGRPPLPPAARQPAAAAPSAWPGPGDPYGGLLGWPLAGAGGRARPSSSSAEAEAGGVGGPAGGGAAAAHPTPSDALPWPAGRAAPLCLTLAFRSEAARSGFLAALASAGGPRAPWGGPPAAARVAKAWAALPGTARRAAAAPPGAEPPPPPPHPWPSRSRPRGRGAADPPIRSNFDFLWALNLAAGRSPNDLASYPVFPWVLASYQAPVLDLCHPASFRDLGKPMGALSPARLAAGRARWADLAAAAAAAGPLPAGPPPPPPGPPPPRVRGERRRAGPKKRKHSPAATSAAAAALAGLGPFMWGSHYSTPGGVAFWLARPRPDLALRLQGGAWDAAHRGFHGLASAWSSASGGAGDFKELTPEFYARDPGLYVPLPPPGGGGGGRGAGGRHHYHARGRSFSPGRPPAPPPSSSTNPPPAAHTAAILPPWAKGSPSALAAALAAALESLPVTAGLHRWVDLIFGVAARGSAARAADNVFHPLTDDATAAAALDLVGQDAGRRAALLAQAAEFGRTPPALFSHPAPPAKHLGKEKAAAGGRGPGSCLRPAPVPVAPPAVPWAAPDEAAAPAPAANGRGPPLPVTGVPLRRRGGGGGGGNGGGSSVATAGGSSLFYVSSHALADLDERSDYG